MKLLPYSLCLLSFLQIISCNNSKDSHFINEKYPEIGDTIGVNSKIDFLSNTLTLILPTCVNLQNTYEYRTSEITFHVSLDENLIVNYIETSDTNFKTEELVNVSKTYKDIQNICSDCTIEKHPGCNAYIKLKSGWNAVFEYDSFFNENALILSLMKNDKY